MSRTMRGMYGSTHSDYYGIWNGTGSFFGNKTKKTSPAREKETLDASREKTSPKKATASVQKKASSVHSDSATAERRTAGKMVSKTAGKTSGKTVGKTSGHTSRIGRTSRASHTSRVSRTSRASGISRAASISHTSRPVRSHYSGRGSAEIVKGHTVLLPAPSIDLNVPSVRGLRHLITLKGILLTLAALLTASAAVILMLFNFESAVVYGNTKYSQEQIESFITRGRLGENTFVMALKYHNRKVEGIPFVDRIHITIINPSTVRVNVIEKPLAGCVSYEGQNVYFSEDGMVEAVSGRVMEEATRVKGLDLTYAETDAQILAKDQNALDLTLEALRDMSKYGIHADEIDVDEKNNLTVTFGDVDVSIGKAGYEQKMYKLQQILPYMGDKSGVISMTGFEADYKDTDIVLSPKKGTEEG